MIKIYIMNGPDKGRYLAFDENMVRVGRSPRNDLALKDRTISRSHMRISRKGRKYYIEDLKACIFDITDHSVLRSCSTST